MAGRIPQDFIDDLLARTDIVDVIETRIKLKRTGRNYSALCPFHKEKSPSFSVNPEKQFYYCFGCGAAGNAIGFLMEHDRLEFPEAVEELARRSGLDVPHEGPQQQRPPTHKPLLELLEGAAAFYQQQLRQHPARERAVTYLKGRGLSGEIAKRFAIGFAPAGWDNLLKHLDPQGQRLAQLDEAGLIIRKPEENKHYDRFRDRIIFPIHNQRGQVIAFGGRVLTDEKPKYLNSPETPVFHKNRELYGLYQARLANRNLAQVIIVEGYMDVVALAQHGVSNAVATLGTATSEHHLQRLFKMTAEIVFCFDGDAAGRTAARRALETALPLMEDGRQARFLFLPEGEDPDSMVRSEGSSAFQKRLQQGTPLPEFFFDVLCEGLNLQALDGRARLSALAQPLLAQLPQGVLQQLMRQRLAELTGLDELAMPPPAPAPASPAPSSSFGEEDYPMGGWEDYEPSMAHGPDFDQPHAYQPPPRHKQGRNSRRYASKGFRGYDGYQGKGYQSKGYQDQRFGEAPPPKGDTLCRRAIGLLLRKPTAASRIGLEARDTLARIHDPLAPLLVELLCSLHEQPEVPTAVLLARWIDTPYWPQLSELAAKEPLLGDDTLEAQFMDCIQRLLDQEIDSAVNQLLKKGKQSPLSVEEKRQLNELLSRRAGPKTRQD